MNANANRLHSALQTLRIHWESSRDDWDDAVSRDFEERHILPVETQVNAVLGAMERLAQTFSKARREVARRPDDY
jgi:hypothetical protein